MMNSSPSRLFVSLLLVLFGALGSVSVASAQTLEPVQVYATFGPDDTGPNGPLGIVDGAGIQSVFLWAAGGPEESTGPVCTPTGTGDPLCGISFTVSVTGGYRLADFKTNDEFDESPAQLPFRITLASEELVANAFDLGDATSENRYLGELQLLTDGVNGDSAIVVTGSAIGANLSMREITEATIVVPEPRAIWMLTAGSLGLFAFAFARRRRTRGESGNAFA